MQWFTIASDCDGSDASEDDDACADAGSDGNADFAVDDTEADFDPDPPPQRSNGPTRPTAARQQAAPCPSCVPCTQCQVGGLDI